MGLRIRHIQRSDKNDDGDGRGCGVGTGGLAAGLSAAGGPVGFVRKAGRGGSGVPPPEGSPRASLHGP